MDWKKLLESTKKNMKRNKFLTISTTLVFATVLVVSSFFISVGIIAQKGIDYYEKRAQVIVFFKRDTREQDILKIKEGLNNPEVIESIEYISQEDALEIYKEDFADNQDLLATVTADSLPPSLEIRAKSVDALLEVIEDINKQKETNSQIDEIMYFKDVVNNLKTISFAIKISSSFLIGGLLVIAFFLIRITIGFNINSHKEEIKVMKLVGGSNKHIRLPYILEGIFYGVAGGAIAATIILVPSQLILFNLMKDAEVAFWLNQLLRDIGLSFIKPINIVFVLAYYIVHILFGVGIGVFSSLSAVRKYLD
ncbi:TPA: FtsX-like permease family protein [Candidatus Dojkabacteria bacterium]|uniref:Cell division protein FtsX n=1 Tax=Candidatus Dojkabacteria bacterium TaxID=2099670 RepID=A0A832R8Z2_9BACT|nr:FtsX-like permease family protein [Candidatus Dojkabacteria bacterium]